MILQGTENCAIVLFSLGVPYEDVMDTKLMWESSIQLQTALCSPCVNKEEKFAVIDKLFAKSIQDYLKVMCEFEHISKLSQIIEAYENKVLESQNILKAKFFYVHKPDQNVIEGIKKSLCNKYGAKDVLLELVEEKSLIGGYRLTVFDTEFDKSIKGSIKQLQNKLIWR